MTPFSALQRILVAADVLAVLACFWFGAVVALAFMGPGRFDPYSTRVLLRSMLVLGGPPLVVVSGLIAAARALAVRGHGGAATMLLLLPVIAFIIFMVFGAR